jgi:Coenzyme PQQ synthesis protein D (PqqD)
VIVAPLSKIAPAANVHAKRFDDEVVILDLQHGIYFGLDEIGAAMWEAFLEGLSPAEVSSVLAARYDAPREQLQHDACILAGRLAEAGLVAVTPPESG